MTALAEAALMQLVLRTADHRLLASSELTITALPQGRHLYLPAQIRNGNALTDLVAVAESFTSGRLLNLCATVSPDAVSTWDKRKTAWAKHGSIDVTASSAWTPLLGFAEVRNALQHGLGRLTQRQLGKHRDQVLSQIEAAGVHLNGDFLTITARDVSECARVCRQFIMHLDATAPFA